MKDDHPPSLSPMNWFTRFYDNYRGRVNTRKELIQKIQKASKKNIIDHKTMNMIEGVFQVSEMQVEDIMIPRGQMVVVDEDGTLEEIHKAVVTSGHSRFPVIDEEHENIVGILLAKDLLPYLNIGDAREFELTDIMRPVIFIPESKRLDVLLKEFRASRNHMAIVIDEYASIAGLVTIEDVLEQIVGEIDDEHDTEDNSQGILARGGGRYTIKALTPVEDFNQFFQSDLPESEFVTMGGLITSYFGRLPKRDESIDVENYHFKIINADSRRIRLLELSTQTQ